MLTKIKLLQKQIGEAQMLQKRQNMKKEMILSVHNSTSKKTKIELLCGLMNYNKPNNGFPDGVWCNVTIKEKGKPDNKIKYSEFLSQILWQPIAVQVTGSTDNRRLLFYCFDVFGKPNAIVPQISPKGVPHYLDPDYVWNHRMEKKHNIADTKEGIIIDGKEIIYVTLKPNEIFKLKFRLLAIKIQLYNLKTSVF